MDVDHIWPSLAVAVVGIAVGLFLPGGWTHRFRQLDRPAVAAALIAAVSLAVNLTVAGVNGVPRPHVNDEYGYLLIADTLLHGRLANPRPPDAGAFASPHVLLSPTYASKYPPAQGFALAVGRLLGHPVIGVWLTCAAAAVAVWWMLLAFVPAPWALLGGIAAAVHPQLVEWGHVYWGGAIAVAAGAIVVGAWGRLRHREAPGVHPGLLLGVGLVVLANSRPYEGFVLSLPLLATLRWRRRWVVPLLVVLTIGGGMTAAYNWAVTGHPLRLPIVAYARQYDVAPKFWPLPLRSVPAHFPNATLGWMHGKFEVGEWQQWQSANGVAVRTGRLFRDVLWTFARPGVLVVPLLFAVGGRRTRWLWATLIVLRSGCGSRRSTCTTTPPPPPARRWRWRSSAGGGCTGGRPGWRGG